MACYHFTIKPDKKPDGSQVSAIDHADYVNREGKYKDIDKKLDIENQLFSGNIICSSKQDVKESEKGNFLYKNKDGSIIQVSKGIETSSEATVETLYIALALAKKKYGSEVRAEGSNDFKAKLIIAACEMNLPITFTDPEMEKQRLKIQEAMVNGKRQLRSKSDATARGERVSKPNLEKIKRVGREAPPQRRHHLYDLSMCGMVQYAESTELLLQSDVPDNVDYEKSYADNHVRWDLSEARRIRADKIADGILTKQNLQVRAASHTDYINRDEEFAAKGGCIYKEHHLPKWANDSAKTFFKAADTYEGEGYCRYKEIEFALPNELTLEQNKEIITTFLEQHLKDFYYAYAVHDKNAVMGNGERNTHVHIMFSERKIDESEKKQERSMQQFFARPFVPSNHNPEMTMANRGGCRKDPKWNSRERARYLCVMRKDFAMIQNNVLEKYGHDVRVDHRTLAAQREDALQRGDTRLAELLDRLPEKHLGPEIAAQENHKEVIFLQKYRTFKAEYRQLLYAADILESSIEEDEITNQLQKNLDTTSTLSSTDIYKTATEDSIRQLKADVIQTLKEITALKNTAIWTDQAIAMAQFAHMSPEEQLAYTRLQTIQKDRQQLQQLRKDIKKPPAWDHESVEVYNQIVKELSSREQEYQQICKQVGQEMQLIYSRLQTPSINEKIQMEVQKILRENRFTKDMLKKSTAHLNQVVPKLQSEVTIRLREQTKRMSQPESKLTARDVSLGLKSAIKNVNLEIEQRKNVLSKLSSKVISLARAQEMAKNVFVKGAFKELREKKRQLLKKELPRIEAAKAEYQIAHEAFIKMKKPHWYQSKDTYVAEAERLTQMKDTISLREAAWNEQYNALDKEFEKLELTCQKPEAQQKISQIAAGMLGKNQPIAKKYESLSQQQALSMSQRNELQQLHKTVQQQLELDRGKHICYHIGGLGSHKNHCIAIAKALQGDEKMARLVARFEDNEEMYDGMTALDRKLIQRDHDIKM